jgi:hypothetical protein
MDEINTLTEATVFGLDWVGCLSVSFGTCVEGYGEFVGGRLCGAL